MGFLKLPQQYKEFAADATLILQSQFLQSLNAETGFLDFREYCPFK
jgi:hypothetical protein